MLSRVLSATPPCTHAGWCPSVTVTNDVSWRVFFAALFPLYHKGKEVKRGFLYWGGGAGMWVGMSPLPCMSYVFFPRKTTPLHELGRRSTEDCDLQQSSKLQETSQRRGAGQTPSRPSHSAECPDGFSNQNADFPKDLGGNRSRFTPAREARYALAWSIPCLGHASMFKQNRRI